MADKSNSSRKRKWAKRAGISNKKCFLLNLIFVVGIVTFFVLHAEAENAADIAALRAQMVDNSAARDATEFDLINFLARDNTRDGEYIPGVHDCKSFAIEMHNKAEAAGLRCAVVLVYWEEGHALNAFLVDNVLTYVEPQSGNWSTSLTSLQMLAGRSSFSSELLWDGENSGEVS